MARPQSRNECRSGRAAASAILSTTDSPDKTQSGRTDADTPDSDAASA
jgi:hypothetical protein